MVMLSGAWTVSPLLSTSIVPWLMSVMSPGKPEALIWPNVPLTCTPPVPLPMVRTPGAALPLLTTTMPPVTVCASSTLS